MKRKITILLAAMLLMSGLSWAQSTLNIESYASANNWTNGTQYLTASVDDVTFTAAGGSNTGKYYTNGQNWRFYQNENATLTISVPDGSALSSITPTFSVDKTGALLYESEVVTSGEAISVSGTSVTFSVGNTGSATNGQVRFTEIEVTYSTGGTPNPSITASNVSIAYDATEGAIAYTINNPVDNGSIAASTESEWLYVDEEAQSTSEGSFDFLCDPNTGDARVATVTLTYTYGEESITKVVTVTQTAAPMVYTTIPDLFAAATSTETSVLVNFNSWVVSGISTNGKNVFVTDNEGNGFVIYDNNAGLGDIYAVNNILSGEISCTLKLYNGFAELLNVNAEDLTITEGGTLTEAAIEMAGLTGVNTGALLHYDNLTCSVSNNKYYLTDGTTTLQVYNALYAFEALENGKVYNITGIYQQYSNTKEILPRSADDIEEVVSTDPSIDANDVTITYDTDADEIEYSINNPVSDGVLTVATTSDWLIVDVQAQYLSTSGTIEFLCDVNQTAASRTATVTFTYTYNTDQTVTKDVIVTQDGNPNITMTIAEVRAQGTGSVATKGIVTHINGVTAYIQDETAAIVVYGSDTPVIGDEIRVEGVLTTYKGLLEIGSSSAAPTVTVLTQGNTVEPTVMTIEVINADASGNNAYQAKLVRIEEATYNNGTVSQGENTINVYGTMTGVNDGDVVSFTANIGCYNSVQLVNMTDIEVQAAPAEPSITVNPAEVSVDAAEHDGILNLAYENLTITDMTDFDIQYYDAQGQELNGDDVPGWIEVSFAEQDPQIGEGYVVSYYMMENEGEARTAYFKVFATGDEDFVYSNLVTVSQAAFAIDYAILPFHWLGGTKDELLANQGVTAFGLGSDYAANNAPYRVKFDGTGDYIQVKTNTNPDYVTIDVKMLGGSNTSTITVQASADGETFDEGEELTISGKQNDIVYLATTRSFDESVRYIRLYFTKGSNVGVGPISIGNYETYNLTINGYGQSEGGYRLIASPVYVNPESTGMITDDGTVPENYTYDLYFFDQTQEEEEWRNYREETFNLVPGKGYLYANKAGVELTFTGIPYSGDGIITLVKNDNAAWAGWNLVGNPFSTAAYLDRDFYIMNEDGTEIMTDASQGAVAAMQGIFVIAENNGETLTFTTETPAQEEANVTLNLTQNRGAVIDRAIVRFGEGRQLPKFQLNAESTKLYIPQGNNDYAVVRSAASGEMPVNFKAQSNGTYTISVDAENAEASYLHLIDNMTGNDIDLLATPSYTFEATTSDYASRFRLVFNVTGVEENTTGTEPFAFFNGSEWVVSNIGNATLQMVDLTGRILSSESINGNATVGTSNLSAGIYLMRLVNGNDVKTQKVVVR